MLKHIADYYRVSKPIARLETSEASQTKYYKRLRLQSFIAATLGYSLYYVCRTSLNVMKKPIIDSGTLDASQLGIMGSTLLFSYAIGKFVNGFIADHCNIKRFMATGLIISATMNFLMGVLGFLQSTWAISSGLLLICFSVMWGVSGWSQSMGAAPAIISLSRWFPLKSRGTYYGIFSASHNLGEFFSFLFVGLLVSVAGWQWGFFGSAAAGLIGVIIIVFFLHDTPESKGLPAIEQLANEKETKEVKEPIAKLQREVLKNPAVWILALSSAFMYISRYAINGWGVLFLQEQKGFALTEATTIVSINALCGVVGTVASGWMSDKLFKGDRNKPALLFGILNTIALTLFMFGGNSWIMNILSMILFGVAIGVLICFIGGLMAVDIVPRKATGAVLGIMGMASYIAAGLQDIVSGHLIESSKHIVDGAAVYDFKWLALFWIGASVLSFLLPLFNWKRHKQAHQ